MKNHQLLFVFLLLFSSELTAQKIAPPIPFPKNVDRMTIVDSATRRVWYALNAQNLSDTLTYDDFPHLFQRLNMLMLLECKSLSDVLDA